MSSYSTARNRTIPSFANVRHSFVEGPGLPLRDVLAEDIIDRIAAEEEMNFGLGAGAVFNAALVLWAFTTQMIEKDQSCRFAVTRIIAALKAEGLPRCSPRTGAYCKARKKLSERFLHRLVVEVGQSVEEAAPDAWRWQGRRAVLVDGTTISAPDTPENQQAYPQPRSQKKGIGFPLIRMAVLLTLATASLIGAAWGPYRGKETGETALLRTLFASLRRDDIVVADRYYCSYLMLALLLARGVDCVFRLHHLRDYDFRRGRRLGPNDHLATWTKPKRPDWMNEETYAALPDTLTLREIRVQVNRPGFRVKELIVVTTLLDADTYTKEEIADLYHKRWHVELDIEAIKCSLQMDVLRCKTPEMLHKEIWAHLLAYNLTRKVMAQAAIEAGINPRQISFTGTMQTLDSFRSALLRATPRELEQLGKIILADVAVHRVGDRPNRCEPRAVKRRPKEYDRLMKPRAEMRAALLHQSA